VKTVLRFWKVQAKVKRIRFNYIKEFGTGPRRYKRRDVINKRNSDKEV
jgi:hypothetical protein